MFFNPHGVAVTGGSWSARPISRVLGIENDQICFVFSGYGKICNLIYRTPEGTRENNDEYILFQINEGTEWFFSAYEERPPALKDKSFND